MKAKPKTGSHYRIFIVKYLSPTNLKGGRIKITDKRAGESKTISYSYRHNNSLDEACEYLASIGINVVSHADLGDCYAVMSDTWAYKSQDEFISVKG